MRLQALLVSKALKILVNHGLPPLKYEGLTVYRCPRVFPPGKLTKTSFLLAQTMILKENFEVLDVGCGTGFLSLVAARKAKRVVAVDVNPEALKCTLRNVKANGLEGKVEVRRGSLFEALKPEEKFDLIVANLPYLPGQPRSLLEAGWLDDGSLMVKLLREAGGRLKPGGFLQTVYSSLGSLTRQEIVGEAETSGLSLLERRTFKSFLETFDVYTFTLKV